MILGMVLIGGLTRLTGSGLSIVEWKPVTGMFPPLTPTDWIVEFSKYQNSPEFKKINFSMTLEEFQSIFFLEYIHRMWGRLIGFVLLIPTFLMIFKKQHRELWPLLALLWFLGLAQAFMGWVMVKSGLNQDPHVSPYRLVGHLFLGFMIFGTALWMTLRVFQKQSCGRKRYPVPLGSVIPAKAGIQEISDIKSPGSRILRKPKLLLRFSKFRDDALWCKGEGLLKYLTLIALALVLLTALFGGFVAGLKAGLIYNTFPLMGEHLVPREFLTTSPWWKDLLENPVTVQFLHRVFAITTTVFCGGLWMYQRKVEISPALSMAFNTMAITILLQVSLGILTLVFEVPLFLALLHQGVAFVLFGSLVYVIFLFYNSQPSYLFGFMKNSLTIQGDITETIKEDWDA